jgi:TolB protein
MLVIVIAALVFTRLTNVIDAYPAEGPNGGGIVFQSNRTGSWQLYTIKSDGSDLRQLTNVEYGAVGAAWSPDGRQIAFSGNPGGNAEIFVMMSDGSNIRRLTNDPADDSHPHWTTSGRIVFTSSRTTPPGQKETDDVFSMKPDGSDLRQHTTCRTVCTYASFSPDMKKLVYRKVIDTPGMNWDLSNATRNSEIFVADADGSNEMNLSKSAAFDGWPMWSPDGKTIAFASNRTGPAYVGHVWLVNPDGTDLRQLSSGQGGFVQPSWTTDGKGILAYQVFEGSDFEYGNIVRIDVTPR